MRIFALWLVTGVAALSAAVLLFEAVVAARAALHRRRRRRRGTFGVVVDRNGRVLGTYLDPFLHTCRAARMHQVGSPWVRPGPDGRGWAWEGFGSTEEEARRAANRLRRRDLRRLPEIRAAQDFR